MARTRLNIAAAIERGTTPQPDYFRTAFDSTKPPAAAVRAEVKQMFALEPDSKINAGNISAKVAVNDLQALRLEGVANDRAAAARTIIEKLNEIRSSSTESGRAEIRNGAMAVAAICGADKALAAEISNAADLESNQYIPVIIDQGHVHHGNRSSVQLAAAALICSVLMHQHLMYGAIGVLLPAAFVLGLKGLRWWWLPAALAVLANGRNRWVVESAVTPETLLIFVTASGAAILGLVLLRCAISFNVWPVSRWGYWFYPGHLMVLYVLRGVVF